MCSSTHTRRYIFGCFFHLILLSVYFFYSQILQLCLFTFLETCDAAASWKITRVQKSCSFPVRDNITIANTTHKRPTDVSMSFHLSACVSRRCVVALTEKIFFKILISCCLVRWRAPSNATLKKKVFNKTSVTYTCAPLLLTRSLAVSFPLFYRVVIFLVPKFCNRAYLRRWRRHQEKLPVCESRVHFRFEIKSPYETPHSKGQQLCRKVSFLFACINSICVIASTGKYCLQILNFRLP